LDEQAVAQVRTEAWPLVRSDDELHDALSHLVTIDPVEAAPWQRWLDKLATAGRATRVTLGGGRVFWSTAENWPLLRAAFPSAVAEPPVHLPAKLEREVASTDAVVA